MYIILCFNILFVKKYISECATIEQAVECDPKASISYVKLDFSQCHYWQNRDYGFQTYLTGDLKDLYFQKLYSTVMLETCENTILRVCIFITYQSLFIIIYFLAQGELL